MTAFLIFVSAAVAGLIVGLVRHRSLGDAWPLAARAGLAGMFAVTGVTHFVVLREDLVAMVPPALPAPGLLVTITGALELAGVVGLTRARTAAWAGGGLALLLVAMFPANVYAATSGATLAGEPATELGPRTAMQVLYVGAAVAVVVAHRRHAARPADLRALRLPLPEAAGPAHSRQVGTVIITQLQLRSWRPVPGFVVASLRLRRAFRRSPGAVSLHLAVQPMTRTFWTWSTWTDDAAMHRYTRSPLHTEVMGRYACHLEKSNVRRLPAHQAPHDWADTTRPIQARHYVKQ